MNREQLERTISYNHHAVTMSELAISILTSSNNIKISKGEESLFIWCVFYSIFEQVIEELNEIQ